LIVAGLLQGGIERVVSAVGAAGELVEVVAASAVGDKDCVRRGDLRWNRALPGVVCWA
jgi:hypothetical protein